MRHLYSLKPRRSPENNFWYLWVLLLAIVVYSAFGCATKRKERERLFEMNKIEYQLELKSGALSKCDYNELMLANYELYKR